MPFVVAMNEFDGRYRYTAEAVHDALGLSPDVPVVTCDARVPNSVKQVLIAVVAQAARAQAVIL